MLIGLYENLTPQQEIPTDTSCPRNDMVFVGEAGMWGALVDGGFYTSSVSPSGCHL